MASGTIVQYFHNSYFSLELAWSESDIDIANNTSKVTVVASLQSHSSSAKISSTASKNISITINGTEYSGTCTVGVSGGGSKTLFTASHTVTHDSNGSKSITISCTLGIAVTLSGSYYSSVSASGIATLSTIARFATISSAPNFTDDENPTITYSNPAGSAVTSLQACISLTGSLADVPYRDIPINGTSYQFVLTEEERNTLRKATPNATSRTVIFFVRTVLAGVTNYSTLSRTFTISDDVKPSATVMLADSEGYLEKYGKYVQGKSKLQVSIDAEGVYGSTIKSYKTTFDGKTFTDATFTTDAIAGKDSLDLEIVVTDSRGRTCEVKESINVYEYNPPKITSIKAKRCQQHNANLIGDEYLGVLFSSTVTSLDEQNSVKYELDYKKTTEDTYSTMQLSDYTGQYTAEGNAIFAADEDAYNIILRITDDFGPIEKKISGPSVSVLVSKLKYNLGIAFGKLAELAGVLDIGFKTRFFGGILQMVLEEGSDFDEQMTPNIFTLKDASIAEYLNCPITEGTGTFTVEECGENKIHQIVKTCDKTNPRVYERFYDEEWGAWNWVNAPYGFITGWVKSITTVEAYGIIPFTERSKNGDYFTLTDGVITVGKNVSCVKVTATGGGAGASGRCWMQIVHNGTWITDAIQYGNYVSPCVIDIFSVNEVDTISISVTEKFAAVSGGVDCRILVERLI